MVLLWGLKSHLAKSCQPCACPSSMHLWEKADMRQKHKRDEGWGAPGRRPAEPRHAGGTEDRAAVALGQELWAVTLAAQASTSEGLEWEAEMLRQQQGWGRQPPHTPVGTEQRAQSKALRLLWQQLPSSSELGRRPRAQEERPQEGAVQDGGGGHWEAERPEPTHSLCGLGLSGLGLQL